jgi:histidyl-tRNA synthetase
VLDGVMEAIGLGGEENAGKRLGVLRAIDKLDKVGWDGVVSLLTGGRLDESGALIPGVGLDFESNPAAYDTLAGFIDWKPDMNSGNHDPYRSTISPQEYVNSTFDKSGNFLILDGIIRSHGANAFDGIIDLINFSKICFDAGYKTDRIKVDFSTVRGLEYYTGPVFEAELTFPVTNEDGQVVRFGSVAGGGRYDGLVGRFRNDPVPATGFSIGVSRLYTALKLTNSPILAGTSKPGPVVVTVMDKDRMGDYQRMVSELRGAGIATELYLGTSGFNAQMKYADKRRSPCVVIQGGDEKVAGTVQVKDLILGAELAKLGKEGKDREEYLERQKEAQFAVPEDALVDAVKKVLARH